MPHLRASEIERELGYSRSALLRWEEEGVIGNAVTRTPGGQRRYDKEKLVSALQESQEADVPARPQYSEMGVTGVNKWSQSDYSEQMEPLKGRKGRLLLREMRVNDAVLSAVFFGINSAIKNVSWRVVPASDKNEDDKRLAEFVDSCLYDMSWSWVDQFSHVYEAAFEQGFSVLEVVYKRRMGETPPLYSLDPATSKHEDGLIGWRKWSPRPALSLLDGDEWIMDDHGGIRGIRQSPEQITIKAKDTNNAVLHQIRQAFAMLDVTQQGGTIDIPIRKLLHFRTTVHPANTPEGLAIHRPAYVPWWMSMNIQEIEGIGVERDLAGIPVLYLGKNTTLSGTNSDYTLGVDLVTNIRKDEQHGVVIPHPKMTRDGEGALLELLATNTRRQYDITEIINRYDKRKAMVTLAQFIMLGMENTGSYALSRHQGDLFVLAVQGFLTSFADIINRHAIPKLVNFNRVAFPTITGFPELVAGPIGVPDLKTLGEFINNMVDKQVITPDSELERHIRQVAGLPQQSIDIKEFLAATVEELGGVGQVTEDQNEDQNEEDQGALGNDNTQDDTEDQDQSDNDNEE